MKKLSTIKIKDSFVEQIAKAFYGATGIHASWAELPEIQKWQYRNGAKAALSRMRNPDQQMAHRAAASPVPEWCKTKDDVCAYLFERMIDVALEMEI